MNTDGDTDFAADLVPLMEKGFALAIQLLRCREDAADVLQESLRKLVHGKRFDARRGSRQAWFLKVVRNGALDVVRQRKPQDEEMVAQLPDEGRIPDIAAEHNELTQIVRNQIEAMPAEQREILLLRDYHDLRYAEIAEVMDIPAGTVMSRLHRARNELRQRMRKYLK